MPGCDPRRQVAENKGIKSISSSQPECAKLFDDLLSTLLVLNAAEIQALCARDPSFGSAFMHHLARALAARLSATRLLLMDLYREDQLPARQERIA